MARRMFSSDIVDSDAFLDMPQSSQLLYFHLGMRADDDGFVSPKKIMRMIGAADDDLKVLLSKRFLLPFDSGVVVIKHWLIHNLIRKDRYRETKYLDEKKSLIIKENGAYTEMATSGLPNGNQSATQVKLGKVKLGKVNISATEVADTVKKNTKENKKVDKKAPMNLEEFIKWCKESPQRHIHIIADYADQKKANFSTRGQWDIFISRNLRAARDLSPYTDEQIEKAVREIMKAEKDYLGRWTLETVYKYLLK